MRRDSDSPQQGKIKLKLFLINIFFIWNLDKPARKGRSRVKK
jgi:hypothetical protein